MSSFEDEILAAHNEYRAIHNVPPMKWSSELAAHAQDWANRVAKKGRLEHAGPKQRKGQGENLATAGGEPMDGRKAAGIWYGEIKDFDFNGPAKYNPNCGHFSQLVWAESTELGAARATSKKGVHFVVARYRPAGNMISAFAENVKPPTNAGQQQDNTDSAAPSIPDQNENKPQEREEPAEVSGNDATSTTEVSETTETRISSKPERSVNIANIYVREGHQSPETERKYKYDTVEMHSLTEPVKAACYRSRESNYLYIGRPYTVTHYIYS